MSTHNLHLETLSLHTQLQTLNHLTATSKVSGSTSCGKTQLAHTRHTPGTRRPLKNCLVGYKVVKPLAIWSCIPGPSAA